VGEGREDDSRVYMKLMRCRKNNRCDGEEEGGWDWEGGHILLARAMARGIQTNKGHVTCAVVFEPLS